MVKVTLGSSLAQKDPQKVSPEEALIPADRVDVESVEPASVRRCSLWCWCMCLGLGLLLSGVAVGGVCLYRSSMEVDPPYFCGMNYLEDDHVAGGPRLPRRQHFLQESVRVVEAEEVEVIEVPSFSDSHRASIVHDFRNRLTTYLDHELKRCYLIPLNSSMVMTPKDLMELLANIQGGAYLPHAVLVRERMVVMERLDGQDDPEYLVIHRMCRRVPTYRLQRRTTTSGIFKREALDCHKILHFENTFVVETQICHL